MKMAVIFGIIVLVGFLIIYMLFSKGSATQNPQTAENFLTPSPTPTVSLNTPTPVPTIPADDRISAKKATIKTEKGNIEIDLFATAAAKTVMNFATLSKRGYYNNLTFHRVEDWVIQGGDPNGNGTGGVSIYGPTFEDEINPNDPLYQQGYIEGTVAMANRGPNTNGSQFFIIKKTTPLQPAYTIFGKVTSGMDVVNQIQIGDKILGIDLQQ
jgi:cyclophilin family peptidyl-prolyl cis-trans isomerase